MRPSPMTTIRSAMVMASRWSCVTTMVVMPSRRCSCRSSTCIASRSFASSADSGSSSRKSRGDRASARAMATRWRCPPESLRRGPAGKARQTDEREQLLHPALLLGLGSAANAQRIGDVFADREMGKQRQRLEHHAEVAPMRRDGGDVGAVEQDPPGARLLEAGDHAQQRRLAAARRTEQADEGAVRHGQAGLLDGERRAEALRNALENQPGQGCLPRAAAGVSGRVVESADDEQVLPATRGGRFQIDRRDRRSCRS